MEGPGGGGEGHACIPVEASAAPSAADAPVGSISSARSSDASTGFGLYDEIMQRPSPAGGVRRATAVRARLEAAAHVALRTLFHHADSVGFELLLLLKEARLNSVTL